MGKGNAWRGQRTVYETTAKARGKEASLLQAETVGQVGRHLGYRCGPGTPEKLEAVAGNLCRSLRSWMPSSASNLHTGRGIGGAMFRQGPQTPPVR